MPSNEGHGLVSSPENAPIFVGNFGAQGSSPPDDEAANRGDDDSLSESEIKRSFRIGGRVGHAEFLNARKRTAKFSFLSGGKVSIEVLVFKKWR